MQWMTIFNSSGHFSAGITVAASALGAAGPNIVLADEPCEPAWHQLASGGEIGVAGSGNPLQVDSLTVWNGDPIAGGVFTTAGGQTVNRIARWDGSAWQPFTSGGQVGVNGDVYAVAVWNGDLIAGGHFTTAGGQTVNRIARWDGSAWHPFTAGGQIGVDDNVWSLTVWNGDLIAGGQFFTAGGQTVNRIARWDGTQWHPFTSGGQTGVAGGFLFSPIVYAVTVWNGDLIAGGRFTMAGGQTVNRIARWDGSAWHNFEAPEIGVGGSSSEVLALTVWNDDLIAGGIFGTAGGQTVNSIARWDGSAWHPFTSGGQIGVEFRVDALTVWNGDLIAGGFFPTAGGQTVNSIARWDGSAWHPFTSGGQIGVNTQVDALTEWNGNLIAGGWFTTAGGQTVNRIARWGLCDVQNPADLNGDGSVGVADLLLLLGEWGECGDCDNCSADLNDDCNVGVADLLILLANWG